MTNIYNSRYTNMKNYELEDAFDMSKKQKEQLISSIDKKKKHILKLQEFYLRQGVEDNEVLYTEAEEYIRYYSYILDKKVIGYFYEFLTFITINTQSKINVGFKTLEYYNSKYVLKFLIYTALTNKEMVTAARLMSRFIDSEAEFDNEMAYYNLAVELNIEEDIYNYLQLMENFKEKTIGIDYLTVEFSFNLLIIKYYLAKKDEDNQTESLLARKELNELILQTISSNKDIDDLRTQVLRARSGLRIIDENPNIDIKSLLTFELLPKPTGIPEVSPINRIK